jgi:hypothetical protein
VGFVRRGGPVPCRGFPRMRAVSIPVMRVALLGERTGP